MARKNAFGRQKKGVIGSLKSAFRKAAIGAGVLVGGAATLGGAGYYQFGTTQTFLVEDISVSEESNWNEDWTEETITYTIEANGEELKDESSILHGKLGDNKIAKKLEDGEAYLITTYGGFGPFTPNITKAIPMNDEQIEAYKEAQKPKPKPKPTPGNPNPGGEGTTPEEGSTNPGTQPTNGLPSLQAAADVIKADGAKLEAAGTKLEASGEKMSETVKKLQKEAAKLSASSGKLSEIAYEMSNLVWSLPADTGGYYDEETGEWVEGDSSSNVEELSENIDKLASGVDTSKENIDKINEGLSKLAKDGAQMQRDGAQMQKDGAKLQTDAAKIAATKIKPAPLSGKQSICTVTFNGKVHKFTIPREAVGTISLDTKPVTKLDAAHCKPVPPKAPTPAPGN